LVVFILLFTASLFSIELGRLYSGSNETYEYLMYPDTVIRFNGNISNPKPENRWIWPWSTATLLFSLVFFIAGVRNHKWSKRKLFINFNIFICSLLSLCLMIFLIAGWKSIYGDSLPYYPNIDKQFSIACLVISIVLFIIFLISLISAGKFINVCTPKVLPRSRSGYQHLVGQGTPIIRLHTHRPAPINSIKY
jgi:hypothetical protein